MHQDRVQVELLDRIREVCSEAPRLNMRSTVLRRPPQARLACRRVAPGLSVVREARAHRLRSTVPGRRRRFHDLDINTPIPTIAWGRKPARYPGYSTLFAIRFTSTPGYPLQACRRGHWPLNTWPRPLPPSSSSATAPASVFCRMSGVEL